MSFLTLNLMFLKGMSLALFDQLNSVLSSKVYSCLQMTQNVFIPVHGSLDSHSLTPCYCFSSITLTSMKCITANNLYCALTPPPFTPHIRVVLCDLKLSVLFWSETNVFATKLRQRSHKKI